MLPEEKLLLEILEVRLMLKSLQQSLRKKLAVDKPVICTVPECGIITSDIGHENYHHEEM